MVDDPSQTQWTSRLSVVPEFKSTVTARTFVKSFPTASRPVLFSCDDKRDYVVKGLNSGRVAINEQVVGRLGEFLGAPVPEIVLVNVPPELVSLEPAIKHLTPGIVHGSSFVGGCTDRLGIAYVEEPRNRDRFARLAILYSWVGANDHQWIYEKSPPNSVWSVDHGHFFPNGPEWRPEHLPQAVVAKIDGMFDACGLTLTEIKSAAAKLKEVDNETIAKVVGGIPTAWNFPITERVALARYLERRKTELLDVVERA